MRSMRTGLLVAGLVALGYSSTVAALRDRRQVRLGSGTLRLGENIERLIVFVGSSTCPSSTRETLRDDLRALASELRNPNNAAVIVRFVGVSTDDDPAIGSVFLTSIMPFDEIVAGRGWVNTGTDRYVFRDSTPMLVIPQVLVFERRMRADSTSIQLEVLQLRAQIVGADSIHSWVTNGAKTSERSGPG